MTHDPISSWAVIQAILGLLVVIIGFFIARTLSIVDKNQAKMFAMIESLSAQLNTLQGEHNALTQYHQNHHPRTAMGDG